MIEKLLLYLLTKVLEYLFGRFTKVVENKQAEVAHQNELEKVNEKVVKKYVEAKDRQERVKAALSVLNRTDS